MKKTRLLKLEKNASLQYPANRNIIVITQDGDQVKSGDRTMTRAEWDEERARVGKPDDIVLVIVYVDMGPDLAKQAELDKAYRDIFDKKP